MSCYRCKTQFGSVGVLWEKKTCQECKLTFCTRCAPRANVSVQASAKMGFLANSNLISPPGSKSFRICLSCKTLTSSNPSKDDLMQLKVKELQNYLKNSNVSINNCVEKKDLVDLVLSNSKSKQDDFSKNYVNSTHRQAFFESLNTNESTSQSNRREAFQSASNYEGRASTRVQESGSNSAQDRHGGASSSSYNEENRNTQKKNSTEGAPLSPDQIRIQLEQIKELNDISELSVRQLKYLLATNRVSFKGAIEKEQLIILAKRLWNQKQNNDIIADNIVDSELCKICMDKPVDCVMLECGHMATCLQCAKPLSQCPICREFVVRVVKTFKS